MRISIRTQIATILTTLVILTVPTGVDSYHYIFTFRNLDFILSEPPYSVFGVMLTRYLCFPYLYFILSGFGFLPPIAPIFISCFIIIRNILIFLSFSNSPFILAVCLIIASLLYSTAASSLAMASLIVLLLKELAYGKQGDCAPSNYEKLEISILFCLVFSSVTMLPISILFIYYLRKRNSKLLSFFLPIAIFVLVTAFVVPQSLDYFSGHSVHTLQQGAFFSRRSFDATTFQERYASNIWTFIGSLGYSIKNKFPVYLGTSILLIWVSNFRIKNFSRYILYIFCAAILSLFLNFNFLITTASPTLGKKIIQGFSQDYSIAKSSHYCTDALFIPNAFTRPLTHSEYQNNRRYCY